MCNADGVELLADVREVQREIEANEDDAEIDPDGAFGEPLGAADDTDDPGRQQEGAE